MKIYLFDSPVIHRNLLPLSFTRPVADFRCGILTIREKWEKYLPGDYGYYPVEYLRPKFGTVSAGDDTALFIAGNILPDKELAELCCRSDFKELRHEGRLLIYKGKTIDFLSKTDLDEKVDSSAGDTPDVKEMDVIEYVFDIFLKNGDEIKKDFTLLTQGRKSAPLPECVRHLKCDGTDENEIFIEDGAVVECAAINTKEGPVYIGKESVLMEGSCIRGPFALCEGAEVRMGSKIYEETTVGPHCKVGGEICNTVFFGYSNKAHDGYLGNAVVGEWCNIGAGTNASNLKNDYSLIRVWNYNTQRFMKTDLQFCGLIMGDHSKIGVNCMINTATVIGVGVNIHGSGFPRQFVSCFSEGSPTSGFSKVPLKKFMDTMERVMSRRQMQPSEADAALLKHIYEDT